MRNNIIPQSRLFLLKDVPLTPDYEYTLDFNSKEEQDTYFGAKIDTRLEEEDYSYIRADDTLNIALPFEETEGVNYLTFFNNGKTYFAFIERKDYVNPNCTKLYFKIDVFQTFMFDYELQESFIDREHQDRWRKDPNYQALFPIYNTQVENLEIGSEYETEQSASVNLQSVKFLVVKTKEPLAPNSSMYTASNNEIPDGYYAYIIPAEFVLPASLVYKSPTGAETAVTNFGLTEEMLENTNILSVSYLFGEPTGISYSNLNMSAIINEQEMGNTEPMFNIVTTDNNRTILNIVRGTEWLIDTPLIVKATRWNTQNISIDKKVSINYEPKLKCYPFRKLQMTCGGQTSDLHPEYCDEEYNSTNFARFHFDVVSTFGLNGKLYLRPNKYASRINYNKMLTSATSFDMNLRTDKWQEYQLNNKASMNGGIATALTGGVLSLGLGALTGGIGWAVAGSSAIGMGSQIANEFMKRQDIKSQPDDIRQGTSDIAGMEISRNIIRLEQQKIMDEYLNQVFQYFTHFGYRASIFKKPNTRSRYYFNYIKTIGVKIQSGIDRRWEDELREIYNRGVTIWHFRNADTFKGVNNYEYENVEMALIGGN